MTVLLLNMFNTLKVGVPSAQVKPELNMFKESSEQRWHCGVDHCVNDELPPLSILDLSTVGAGQSSGDALAASTQSAQLAENLGYTRYWVAEHHNFAAVASTTPSVLLAHIGAHTNSISLGSGGVMLPNHSALAIAEQFAMLEALHPDRIDLGIGRAPGTDGRTALALRRGVRDESADEFPAQLLTVMAMLGDDRTAVEPRHLLSATPNAQSHPNVILLGSSTFSAQLAGQLGLPFAFAEHFSRQYLEVAVEAYRATFVPSKVLEKPYLIIATSALAAETDEEALELSMPGRMMTVNIRRGQMAPLPTVADAVNSPDYDLALEMTPDRICGSLETVKVGLQKLAAETGADELMINTVTYDVDHRMHSMKLVAS